MSFRIVTLLISEDQLSRVRRSLPKPTWQFYFYIYYPRDQWSQATLGPVADYTLRVVRYPRIPVDLLCVSVARG
jgi:hypothetical protein